MGNNSVSCVMRLKANVFKCMDSLFAPSRLKFPAKGAKDTPSPQSVMPSGFAPFAGNNLWQGCQEVFYIIQKSMFDSRSNAILEKPLAFYSKKGMSGAACFFSASSLRPTPMPGLSDTFMKPLSTNSVPSKVTISFHMGSLW